MKITTTVQFHSELEFLEGWFKDAERYSDEIICAAHNPQDGSLEWVKNKQLNSKIPIKILEFPEDTIFKHGFSYMKNKMIEQATGDWIVSLDADEEMDITKEKIETLSKSNHVCISTVTMHVADRKEHWSLDNREQIRKEANWIRQRHFRIFKNLPNLRWYGLIHEELKLDKNIPISAISKASTNIMWHYGCMANKNKRTFKNGLYAELLCRIVDNPELRHGTNNWWVDKYYKDNEAEMRRLQSEYLKNRKQ